MKRGFIRAFWGTSDVKYDEGWANPSTRYARMENDIKIVMSHPNTVPFITYIYGQENYDMAKKLGVQECVLVNKEPFIYDLQKEFWKHKLDIFQYAMEEDGFDEMVYLDWDCLPVKPLFEDFWEILGRKESLQCNLQFYRRRKCLWRDTDWRKTCNGGVVYIRDKKIPAEFQKVWAQFESAHKFWDEVTISKYIDNLTGGWEGSDYYWTFYEPEVCNLTMVKKNRSAFTNEQLSSKNICFEHFIQALVSRTKRFLKDE
jgi:hypothetical protein